MKFILQSEHNSSFENTICSHGYTSNIEKIATSFSCKNKPKITKNFHFSFLEKSGNFIAKYEPSLSTIFKCTNKGLIPKRLELVLPYFVGFSTWLPPHWRNLGTSFMQEGGNDRDQGSKHISTQKSRESTLNNNLLGKVKLK